MSRAGRFKPLSPRETHQVLLSGASWVVLACLLEGPERRSNINPGVSDRLLRERLIEERQEVDPTLKRPKQIPMIYITDAGRAELKAAATGGPA